MGGCGVTEITGDHVEWAVVDRLRQMLEEPPHEKFNVTQTYALFTTVMCWVVGRIRVTEKEIRSAPEGLRSRINNELAAEILRELSDQRIDEEPWAIQLTKSRRNAQVGTVDVLAPLHFSGEHLFAERFLINLRDAAAHGDARNVKPFHVGKPNKIEQLLAGFTFHCQEKEKGKIVWWGEITLLEDDMRRIGRHLAMTFCDALRREVDRSDFVEEAVTCVREAAA
jgi:hypothetical protein